MTRAFLVIELESRWRANVRGPGSWQLCREAGRCKPPYSPLTRSWVVSETTARKVAELAERHGMGVVMTGPRMAAARTEQLSTAVDSSSSDSEQEALW